MPTRLVMIGDSITEWGRPSPASPDYATALGHGYVSLVAQKLPARFPARRFEVFNRGVGGNTVRDLAARWQRDVLNLRPDWLSVMIGINDVWRYFDPQRQPEAVPHAEYEQTLDRLLATARPQVSCLVLLTPFYVQPSKSDPMRARMDEFGAIAARLAPRHDALLVDTQAAIDRLLAHHTPTEIAHDLVHVGPLGHEAFANAFVDAVATRA
jgi:lysophospholipase L1-like esterase